MTDDELDSFLDRFGDWFDYDGNPITMREWAMLTEDKRSNPNGRWRVARTEHDGITVSTVWIGISLGLTFDNVPPYIYETMVFRTEGVDDDYTRRYKTRDAAEAGHVDVCREVFA